MPRPKKLEAGSLKDLYTEAITEMMYLKRAWRVLKEHHPDFRNLGMPESRDEEALSAFLGQVKHIAEEAQHKGGGGQTPATDEVIPMYIGLDIEPMYNPATAFTADLYNDEEE